MQTLISPFSEKTHIESSCPITEHGIEEAVDQLRAMLFQEQTNYPSRHNSLVSLHQGSEDESSSPLLWRRRVCEWIFETVDHYSFDREVASIALHYLDRSVALELASSDSPMNQRQFQLFAVTSLYLAIKLHGESDPSAGRRLKLRISTFVELSRGFFSVATIEAMERYILSLLNWHVNVPTAAQYVAIILRLLPEWEAYSDCASFYTVRARLYDLSKYFTELACFHYATSQTAPSAVAYAALLCAIESMQSTTPLPSFVYHALMANIASVSADLSPSSLEVAQVVQYLKSVTPDLFDTPSPPLERVVSLEGLNEIDLSQDSSRDSPTCVCEGAYNSPRKRAKFGP